MSKLSIDGIISKSIFNRNNNAIKSTQGSQTNPFGVSFKGNILTADVFKLEQPKKLDLITKMTKKSKLVTSTFVSSINKFGSEIGERLDSVMQFGRNIRDNAKQIIQRTGEDFANLRETLKTEMIWDGNRIRFVQNKFRAKNLEGQTVTYLGDLWKQELELLENTQLAYI